MIGGVGMTFGALGLRRSMRGEAPAYLNVRPHLQGIPLPFTVKTNPAFVAIQRLVIGMMSAGLALKIAMMAAHR